MEILDRELQTADIPPTALAVEDALYCHLETRVCPSTVQKVACAGREHCRPDYQISRDHYACSCLELVVQGRGKLRIGTGHHALYPGLLFSYGPGVAHEIISDPAFPMTKYFVSYFGPPVETTGAIQPGELRTTTEPDRIAQLFEALIREGLRTSPLRAELCAQYLRLILLKTAETHPPAEQPVSAAAVNLRRCQSLLDEHFETICGLEDLARAVHLDPHYICRLFKRFGLPSPYQYLTTRRMNRAAQLLVTTGEPVKAVAARCGYDDQLHFSRIFRRHFGSSPTTFRQSWK